MTPLDLSPIAVDAPDYGDFHDELPLWSAPFGLALLERVPLGPALTLLDIGAGTGFLAIELAERCGPGSRVIAVDPWPAAVQRLQRKLARRRLAQVHVMQQDAATLDLPEASVDVIVSCLGLNNFADPPAVLARCARVARPGAALLLATNLQGHMAELYAVLRDVLRAQGQADRLPTLDAHIAHRATPEGLTRLLADAGFTVTDTALDSFRLRFADGTALLRHHLVRLGFLPDWMALAAPGTAPAVMAALEQALNARAATDGGLTLTVPMACVTARRDG